MDGKVGSVSGLVSSRKVFQKLGILYSRPTNNLHYSRNVFFAPINAREKAKKTIFDNRLHYEIMEQQEHARGAK